MLPYKNRGEGRRRLKSGEVRLHLKTPPSSGSHTHNLKKKFTPST